MIERMSTPRALTAWLAMAAVLMLSIPAAAEQGPVPSPAAGSVALLAVPAVAGELPRTDPDSPSWKQATAVEVALYPQDWTEPKVLVPGVARVDVSSLHDGAWIAFLLSWSDPTDDRVISIGRFSDAVSVQIPTLPGADLSEIAMGQQGKAVEIQFWKAAWQEASEGRPTTSKTLYPNLWVDRYPEECVKDKNAEAVATRTLASRAAANPTQPRLKAGSSPVQDLLAEGFGTLTALPDQRSVGRGVYKDGRWRVVIARPLAPLTRHEAVLVPGRHASAAFAIWDGSAGQAGARKMRSDWLGMNLGDRR
ncbi:MAG: hypothetical protein HY815_27245 [Candidatus Riflebacteria bacterium]|nr:hypothetical protein [Candidatus Riflebacteria bacterium]